MYHLFLHLTISGVALGSISDECVSSWEAMRTDTNFIYVNETSLKLCYVQYQNAVAVDPTGAQTGMVVGCTYVEYVDYCSKYVSGGATCTLDTGWLSFNICIPGACSSTEDMSGLIARYYNPVTSTINCSKPPPSAVLPAVLTTISVLLFTVCLIFSFRPPADVLNARDSDKAKRMMRTLSNEASRQ